MSYVTKIIQKVGVVPVIKLDSPDQALPLAEALVSGGLPVAEVTFRTDAAQESIQILSDEAPDILVGAGTVINTEQLERAYTAGAKFIVSPGFSRAVVERSLALGLPVFPGCATPSEIIAALDMGLETVKFFPAENYGGLKTIKALAAAFPQVKFIPTGGVSPANLAEYLSCPKILACGGSWMIKPDLAETERLCKEAREIVEGIQGNS
ncbi:MAG: bifunctional 4-hydroxy-2-oxoglutarate aldolase/2-dehydro-3-deoxy-phosphogluconate aldolase [Oscillospiraceae bacterium]|nr:bifunctional 4-hydroxy-2-oxoglutarate aldolase/2-dehydro-3-deoxy-phosphogluconate aldolase [Oscillospiraceae bacterium]